MSTPDDERDPSDPEPGNAATPPAPSARDAPSPETIVDEFTLVSPPSPAAFAERRERGILAYRVLRTTQVDEYEEAVTRSAVLAEREVLVERGDDFRGTARRAAKIAIARAETERFADVRELIASLPPDREMARRRIDDGPDSGRVDEEKRNVRLRAFLYAASREDDNDFHLIIGQDPRASPVYMTAEVSGLPPTSSPHRRVLENVRDTYKAFFSRHREGIPGSSYDFYLPRIPIEIEGSLFFDATHSSGSRPGPRDLRPNMPTVWEIHPVTRITFEP
ncbi:MAG TPA: hypothetical protein VFQ45_21185 [Longimicrobium sp.]|nr:hypothetical protein [Longimicrobium sp.]